VKFGRRIWRIDRKALRMSAGTDRRLLLLDEADNVLVATARIRTGERIVVEGQVVALAAELPIGHKLARRKIGAGERVVKYGAPIGVATADIDAGSHVHVHNLRSDYTPTYHLEAVRKRSDGTT
jgi:hypothetical protein